VDRAHLAVDLPRQPVIPSSILLDSPALEGLGWLNICLFNYSIQLLVNLALFNFLQPLNQRIALLFNRIQLRQQLTIFLFNSCLLNGQCLKLFNCIQLILFNPTPISTLMLPPRADQLASETGSDHSGRRQWQRAHRA